MAKAKKFDDYFSELETVISDLECGELSLEESFRRYKDGIKLLKSCNDSIDKIEKQIIILSEPEEEDDGPLA
ncbi:exodeoxyribonuclease VII small subunit [Anaerolentibacter hominis]|uniref:exodeoxyribonuclease VII small subunit n=1 Tax=Anaerolentibacter hominis TaxID=3079009 RepID=UPI0031B88AA7